jgi:adenylate cyclase
VIDAEPATGAIRARSASASYAAAAMTVVIAVGAATFWYLSGQVSQSPSEIAAVEANSESRNGNSAAPSARRRDAIPTATAPPRPTSEVYPAPSADQGIPVILVLPFEDLTADQTHSDLGRGIAEAFINDLSTFPDFEVVSSTTSFRLFDKTIPEIVQATGALFVIGGSVRRARDKALITAQLIRGSTDRQLKIAQFEENMSDSVTLQSAAASRIRDELGGLSGALRNEYAKIIEAKAAADLTVYDYYILGHVHHTRFTPPEVQRGREFWEQGLARFPDSALLRCKLSFSFHWLGIYSGTGKEHETANRLVAEAEAMQKKSRLEEWECHWASSRAFTRRGDLSRAVAETRAAVAMAPYYPSLRAYGATVLLDAGLDGEAIEWAKFAVTHDPNAPESYFNTLFDAYRSSRRMHEAVELAKAEIRSTPSPSRWWFSFLQKAYAASGQMEKAEEAGKMFAGSPEQRQQ